MEERWKSVQGGSMRGRRLDIDGDEAPRGHRGIRALIVALVVVAVLLVVALVAFIVLSSSPAFTITSIDTESTEHLSAENIAKLANVEEGTTLLTIDEEAISENLKRNPWVGSVSFTREFPDRLKIVVTERRVDCIVKMSTGSVCWCLGDDGVWIEPVNLTVADGQSAEDVALALAQEREALLIKDVPTSLSPTAGETATNDALKAVAAYREQFSEEFLSQIVCFSASSVESIACTLSNGVEVSLGAPSSIDVKEALIRQILEKHPNQITYINVRVPSQPSYRRLGTESVSEGTGVKVDTPVTVSDDAQQTVSDPTAQQTTQQDGSTQGDGTSAGEDQQAPTGEGDAATTQDTSDLILGDDGTYYTYEQYWGLDG